MNLLLFIFSGDKVGTSIYENKVYKGLKYSAYKLTTIEEMSSNLT